MQVTLKDVDEVSVIVFDGNLDTNTAPQAQEQIDQVIDGGSVKLLINFENLNYISASGDLKICNLNETVQEVFDISGFSTILTVVGSEEEALSSF
jgi:anti-anti-sigma regulatory factor